MARILVNLPGFTGVGAGQTAIANIPLGLSYHALVIGATNAGVDATTQANINTHFTRWQLKVNGRPKYDLSGSQHYMLNQYHGHVDEPGVRTLWFTQPKQATLNGEDAMLYGTKGLQTMTLEVDIGAGATSPTLDVKALIDPRSLPLGSHRVVEKLTETIGATGTYNLLGYPPKRGRLLEKVHFNGGTISAARLIANNQDLFNVATKYAKSINGAMFSPFSWQAGWWHLDMTMARRLADVLNIDISDFRIELTAGATGTLTSLWECIDTNPA